MSRELRQLLGYWHGLGGGKTPPSRSHLDLRQLASILRWMFILEMDNSGTLKFRLAGSCIEEALGCGMTDRPYSDLLSAHEDGNITEELYALSLVQGCGLLRSGTFTFDGKTNMDMQVLALPFADQRAMGGVVMVGVVKPFDFNNHGFIDRRSEFEQFIDELLTVPSPRFISTEALSDKLAKKLEAKALKIRVLDIGAVLESEVVGYGITEKYPSRSLSSYAAQAH